MKTISFKTISTGLLLAVAVNTPNAAENYLTINTTREAFSQPMSALTAPQMLQFFQGRRLFQQVWLVNAGTDAESAAIDGLGPVYNRLSCSACHPKNGRGQPPETPDSEMRSMLVRLSIPGQSPHGGPNPHPVYGEQLNEHGIPNVPGEGRARIVYQEVIETLADGEAVKLRQPTVEFVALNFGDMGKDILTSLRVAPAIFGLGLLEAIEPATLLSLADPDDKNGDGISGRANQVWDVRTQQTVLGRFGWKANQPNVAQQIAGAFIGDLGITSALFPTENCTDAQPACRQAISGGSPELSVQQLEDIEFYHFALAVPSRRAADDPHVKAGEQLFSQLGCAQCHTPTLTTGEFPQLPALSHQIIHPYTDLLLHDMGAQLADGRPDYAATGQEWRTPPLWGLGLIQKVNGHSMLLHDGRARNLLEAILWHDGEARTSKEAVKKLTASEREALFQFLNSL
jgi:CxxC motif-containing protein (DUF1111 family)